MNGLKSLLFPEVCFLTLRSTELTDISIDATVTLANAENGVLY